MEGVGVFALLMLVFCTLSGCNMKADGVVNIEAPPTEQVNPLKDRLNQVPELGGEKITVAVPVQIEGSAKGVKEGGILEEILREISVECLPTNIPNLFSIDVTELEIGHSIHVNTLEIEEGVNILHEDEDTIVTVLAPKVEAEPTEEEIEGEEGTEEAATEEAQEEGSEEGS